MTDDFGPDTQTALLIIREWLTNKDDILHLKNLNLTRIPPLPDDVEYLWVENIPVKTLPLLPSKLRVLNCTDLPIIELPELPLSLTHISFIKCPRLLVKRNEPTAIEKKYLGPPHLAKKYIIYKSEPIQAYRERWRSYYDSKKRCKDIKGELMAATWHPDRYIDWCLTTDEQLFHAKERTQQEWIALDF